MGLAGRLFFVVTSVILAYSFQAYRRATKPLPVPDLDLTRYWGPGKAVADNTKIEKFTIDFKNEDLTKLKSRLVDTSYLTPPLEDVQFQYGMNTNKLKSVVNYWRDTYLEKWYTERQVHLNKFPQFKTKIQGLNIHYIHVVPQVSKSVKVYPLILLHGWPGSIVEFYDFIPLLTTVSKDRDYVFEVIAPSLPGYGFSDPAAKQGLHYGEMAIIFRNLMLRLGKQRFFVQGGDWGAAIGASMTTFFPDNVIGFHSTMCSVMSPMANVKLFVASLYPKYFVEEEKHVDWHFPIGAKFMDLMKESGYMHLQATKPDTVGAALSNNPVGLAAYILEKFSTWTNLEYRDLPDGGLEKYYTMDQLLDNVMVYYMTNSILTSQRLYKESMSNSETFDIGRMVTSVPTGCAKFRWELINQIDWILKDKYQNLIQSTYHDDGGHFVAMQLPKVLYKDFILFVNKMLK